MLSDFYMGLVIVGYGRNQRLLCGGLHPKPMVTPVHRFQSIESVAHGGLRPHRAAGCHSRLLAPCGAPHATGSSARPAQQRAAGRGSAEMAAQSTLRRDSGQTNRLKCGVWAFFAIVTFFLAGAKYYFHGVNIGIEAFAFCSLLVIILVIGGLVSLYEAIAVSTTAAHAGAQIGQGALDAAHPAGALDHHHHHHHRHEPDDGGSAANQPPMELPPPPYHIAIMLPSQNSTHLETTVQIIRDSPPPSYEKAVT